MRTILRKMLERIGSGKIFGTHDEKQLIGSILEFRNLPLQIQWMGPAAEILNAAAVAGHNLNDVANAVATEVSARHLYAHVTLDADKFAQSGDRNLTAIAEAIKVQNYDKVRRLVEANLMLIEPSFCRELFTLEWAAWAGSIKLIERLLFLGCNVNEVSWHGMAPLHWAAARNHVKVVEFLLKSGAAKNARNDSLWTPADVAAANRSRGVINVLMRNGVEITKESRSITVFEHMGIRFNKHNQ